MPETKHRETRKRAGWSIEKTATAAGVSARTAYKFEAGLAVMPSARNALSAVYGQMRLEIEGSGLAARVGEQC